MDYFLCSITSNTDEPTVHGFQRYLKFSDTATAAANQSSSNNDIWLVAQYVQLRQPNQKRNRSRAQDDWLMANVEIKMEELCSVQGSKDYQLFIHSITKKSKTGKEVLVTQEGAKAYWKALNRYMEGKNYFPDAPQKKRMKVLHKSVGAIEAKNRADGELDATKGADCIPLDLHDWICAELLERGGKDDIKYLLVILLAFNFFWRINKVFSINLEANHLSWSQDALRVWLFSSKADKEGKLQQQVHSYSNSKKPHQCVITILGLYFALHDREINDWLFPAGTDIDLSRSPYAELNNIAILFVMSRREKLSTSCGPREHEQQ